MGHYHIKKAPISRFRRAQPGGSGLIAEVGSNRLGVVPSGRQPCHYYHFKGYLNALISPQRVASLPAGATANPLAWKLCLTSLADSALL